MLALAWNEGVVSKRLSWPPLLFMGTISYSIYMLHVFVLEVTNVACRAIQAEKFGAALGVSQSLLALLVLLVVVVALASVLHDRVEVPARAAFRRRAPAATGSRSGS